MTGVELRAHPERFVAYGGRSLLETNPNGIITGPGQEGFYYQNTRLLSRWELTADGQPLQPIAASPVHGNGFLAYAYVPQGEHVPSRRVYVTIAHFLGNAMRTELTIENCAVEREARLDLAVHLAADFADLKETTVPIRGVTGPVETTWDEQRRELRFRYLHPDLDRAVAIRVTSEVPVHRANGALIASLRLTPHRPIRIDLAVEPIFDGQRHPAPARVFDESAAPLGSVRERIRVETPRLRTTNATVARAWQTAVDDLASLPLGDRAGPAAPSAGIPAYQDLYGRDILTIGWQSLLVGSSMLRDALTVHAAYQGTKVADYYDEQPGKLIGLARDGPYSVLGLDPQHHYYGDYAAQPDFLIMLGQYFAWTNDSATVQALVPTLRRLLTWLDRDGDLDGDGFLEYVTRSSNGVKNQGWKDSPDAIVYQDGKIVPNPIAPCEIQGYWYVGLQQAAIALLFAHQPRLALRLWLRARDLKRRFNETFWIEEEGFYALALDPHKRRVRSIASNAGQLLSTGIVPRDRGRRVAQRMMAPDMFSGWGCRTLSADHVAYDPFNYHLGSVWPVENATFAFGFARYGCIEEMFRLTEGLFALTELFVANRLPEDVGGVQRDATHPHPGIYPGANEPQGWSASMIPLLIQAFLGLRAMAPLRLLLLDPHLPPWLPDLKIEGIRVGGAVVDLELRRGRRGKTAWRVTRQEGFLLVLEQPVPEGPNATLRGRLSALLRSPWHWF